jgi:hypothetical protein
MMHRADAEGQCHDVKAIQTKGDCGWNINLNSEVPFSTRGKT